MKRLIPILSTLVALSMMPACSGKAVKKDAGTVPLVLRTERGGSQGRGLHVSGAHRLIQGLAEGDAPGVGVTRGHGSTLCSPCRTVHKPKEAVMSCSGHIGRRILLLTVVLGVAPWTASA